MGKNEELYQRYRTVRVKEEEALRSASFFEKASLKAHLVETYHPKLKSDATESEIELHEERLLLNYFADKAGVKGLSEEEFAEAKEYDLELASEGFVRGLKDKI